MSGTRWLVLVGAAQQQLHASFDRSQLSETSFIRVHTDWWVQCQQWPTCLFHPGRRHGRSKVCLNQNGFQKRDVYCTSRKNQQDVLRATGTGRYFFHDEVSLTWLA
jgi:hypothetical protein